MTRSISKLFAHTSVALMAPVAIACFAPACSSDDPVPAAPGETDGGGAPGNTGGGKNTGGAKNTGGGKATGGTAGAGGATGGSPGTGGATGGTAGATGGTAGTGGTDAGAGGTPATGGAPAGGAGGTDGGDACAPLSLTPPTVTAAIQVPAGATVVQHFHAEGTQDFTCKGTALADAGTSYSWGSSIPDAKLFTGSCQVGTHYAGPSWESADGSKVVAARVNGEPHSGTIPWLLLKVTSNTGSGILSNVTFIQRTDTTGGVAPSDPCDAGHVNEVKKIPYTAEYYFFEGGLGDAGP